MITNNRGVPTTELDEDTAYSFAPVIEDVDGDTLTFSILNQPNWLSFDLTTGELTGVPEDADVGTYSDIEIGVSMMPLTV